MECQMCHQQTEELSDTVVEYVDEKTGEKVEAHLCPLCAQDLEEQDSGLFA